MRLFAFNIALIPFEKVWIQYIYWIHTYIKRYYIQELPQKSGFASNKIFIRWWPWVQAWFRSQSIITTNPVPPPVSISHNTMRLYWMVFNLYECHIRSDAVTVLFWIFFFIYSLFSAGESPSLVINVEVEFEIKPRHQISRGNMSVDQPFLTHCSRRSSYFSNLRWCAQSMLASKGIVNSVMITFFELTDQMTRSGRWRVDVISVGKASCRSTSAITRQSVQYIYIHWIYIYIYIYIYI